MGEITEIADELEVERLVQSELYPDLLDRFLGSGGAGKISGGMARTPLFAGCFKPGGRNWAFPGGGGSVPDRPVPAVPEPVEDTQRYSGGEPGA